ncbi:bifunctional diaminohydroxyphosphoribosylaminopyrimidine deaminase/5-amino-6-(5-phosphoribosylamino)uracil reductase RibD [Mangrovibacillus cuniculi]|uniref:Riboflavin biosynthesis protein RibD n=1 Tax=Mangrovibacillus cuniculi TaxID=2593652 RepID=A0A7S8CAX8_9BACI|nr:bifunctional diaminohydroxyphosphoribosylaminopyrimidine deaminase/5-amino-6-(5-phosphoribosylamino)uracil reductase RibD [Mangrovibacillus cuniculi]QPC46587.1 bifunctional diaminohydroxyphosphoribosylaminopyrimidine deaminase/5-amino-6-(5-phosphoribosylamino)uracil reductase RibD [Mangrovibacillus cuniculi]
MSTSHERFMQAAIAMASVTHGQTAPNPAVGCVIVKDGRIVGMGAHFKAGEPHAEVMALKQAGDLAKGADVYVTLEPCAHFGKTPPCADTLVTHNVKRVFIATTDPNPLVAGKGIEILKRNNISVEVGVCEEEAQRINRDFFFRMANKRPWITLKSASTLDGKTATRTFDSKWITSTDSREDGHLLRHHHQAILVGLQTVIHDNPSLTCRLPGGGVHPIRFILDTQLNIPKNSTVLHDGVVDTIIVCGANASLEKEKELTKEQHVSIWRSKTERVELSWLVKEMAANNILSLLVEGGATVQSSFVKENLFDEFHHYLAPKLIGGQDSHNMIADLNVTMMKEAIELKVKEVKILGPDVKLILTRKD